MADTPVEKKPPTPNLRVELVHVADAHDQVVSMVSVAEFQYAANQVASTPEEDAQALVDADYINELLEADEARRLARAEVQADPNAKGPTPGLRIAAEDDGVLVFETEASATKMMHLQLSEAQMQVNLDYVNWLIETDEQRRAYVQMNQAGVHTDVLVDMGNMQGQSIRQVNIQDEAYEAMVEDILGNFNHIVTQGIRPIVALHAMGFAFAITLGACLRANLADNEADALLFIVRNNAKNEAGRLKLVTKQ